MNTLFLLLILILTCFDSNGLRKATSIILIDDPDKEESTINSNDGPSRQFRSVIKKIRDSKLVTFEKKDSFINVQDIEVLSETFRLQGETTYKNYFEGIWTISAAVDSSNFNTITIEEWRFKKKWYISESSRNPQECLDWMIHVVGSKEFWETNNVVVKGRSLIRIVGDKNESTSEYIKEIAKFIDYNMLIVE